MKLQKQKGFSLIELLVVIAIIGILMRVALPAYGNYVTRGKIPDATANLASKRTQMEQSYQDNRTYTPAVAIPACVLDNANPAGGSTSKYFTFSCPAATLTATTYTIQAVGVAAMAGFTYT